MKKSIVLAGLISSMIMCSCVNKTTNEPADSVAVSSDSVCCDTLSTIKDTLVVDSSAQTKK